MILARVLLDKEKAHPNSKDHEYGDPSHESISVPTRQIRLDPTTTRKFI